MIMKRLEEIHYDASGNEIGGPRQPTRFVPLSTDPFGYPIPVKEKPALLEKLLARIALLRSTKTHELAHQANALEQTTAVAASLLNAVERAETDLATAETRVAGLRTRLIELDGILLQVWTVTTSYSGAAIPLDFSGKLNCVAGIEDFLRVKPILVSRLHEARDKLAKFQQQHDL
jgi:hypothetical protein